MNDTEPKKLPHKLVGRDGQEDEFVGEHLGTGSSYHPTRVRWFVVDLYFDTDKNEYVVHTRGMSTVEGEGVLSRVARTKSAFDVVELLTVRKCTVCFMFNCTDRKHEKKLFIPRQSARALAQAAQWDDDIRDAYVNRVV